MLGALYRRSMNSAIFSIAKIQLDPKSLQIWEACCLVVSICCASYLSNLLQRGRLSGTYGQPIIYI